MYYSTIYKCSITQYFFHDARCTLDSIKSMHFRTIYAEIMRFSLEDKSLHIHTLVRLIFQRYKYTRLYIQDLTRSMLLNLAQFNYS